MKLWDKGIDTDKKILDFTIGNDRELDMYIAAHDVVASISHVKMLSEVGLVAKNDAQAIILSLTGIYEEITSGNFQIEEGMEDIHSQLEKILVDELGEAGKRVHTARSRNDQVLVALKLYYRDEIINITMMVRKLVRLLIERAKSSVEILIPGYTHMQAAMYSSFGLWFSAWAEAFTEDLYPLAGAMDFVNMNPLGSAAGYGSSFPVDRELTTELLAFNNMHVNSLNAQLARGKTEKILLSACANIAGTLSKMSFDLILFMNQNFNFVYLSDELTTGSSIMPHKKNPDILEILRAKSNRIQAREYEVHSLVNNLPSGYHRDFQLLKDICFPTLRELKECLEAMSYLLPEVQLRENITDKEIYRYLGSVDAINEKVIDGNSFREAYKQVAGEIKDDTFVPVEKPEHNHIGSLGNLSTERISEKLEAVCRRINIEKYQGFNEGFIKKIKNGEI